MTDRPIIAVEVISAWPDHVWCRYLTLPAGSTVGDAMNASGWYETTPECDTSRMKIGIYGRIVSLEHPLRDGDRVEVYRPLVADPREARRKRAAGPG